MDILDPTTLAAVRAAADQEAQIAALIAPWAGGNVTLDYYEGATLLRQGVVHSPWVPDSSTPRGAAVGAYVSGGYSGTAGTQTRVVARAGSTDVLQWTCGVGSGEVSMLKAIGATGIPQIGTARGGSGLVVAADPNLPIPAADYVLDFTALGANESPISVGSVWTNASIGTGGNAALAPNISMQIRLSADSTTRICCETGATNDYDDSLSFVPGFAGNQRVQATIYRAAGYAPSVTNHEMEIHVGCVSFGTNNKRCIEFGFNYAGGYFIAGFNGDLNSWNAPAIGNMSSPWYSAATGAGSAPADGDVMRVELNRTAKTCKCWQNDTLVVDLQWNDTTYVTSAAQAVLNDLGDGAGLGALRRIGGDATEGAFGWRDILISSTLLG